MADREKVIRALEWCIKKPCHPNCPYFTVEDESQARCLFKKILPDALDLLKEQEPRVLEYSEIEKHPLVWLEDNGKEDVIPALFLQYNGWNVEFALQAPDEWVDMIVRCATAVTFEKMYGTTWRAWTSRPSPKQMRDTKWEGEKDAD